LQNISLVKDLKHSDLDEYKETGNCTDAFLVYHYVAGQSDKMCVRSSWN